MPNKANQEIREIARNLLEDAAYRAALQERLIAGSAGAVEVALYHYAYGKPRETIELTQPMRPVIIDLLAVTEPPAE